MARRKLLPSTTATKIATALEVYNLRVENPKMSLAKACRQVGIDPRTYNYWITQAPEALQVLRDTQTNVQRGELAEILIARQEILGMLIHDGKSRFTPPIDRLAIHQYLGNLTQSLIEQVTPMNREGLEEILGGPKQIRAESRFAPGSTPMLEISAMPDGSVNVKGVLPDVIEGEIVREESQTKPISSP